MRKPKKKIFVYLAVTAAVTCALCATAACAMADTEDVSLANMPKPSMPFTPEMFGEDATMFPSDGNKYVSPSATGPNTMEGVEGRGPHGGYDTTTNKCGVCHAAHSADGQGDPEGVGDTRINNRFLIRAGMTGCEYCHVGSTGLLHSTQVYTADGGDVAIPNKADLGYDSGHRIGVPIPEVPASDLGPMTLSCTSCHSVHGVSPGVNWMPRDFYTDASHNIDASHKTMDTAKYGYKLLLASPGGKTAVPDTASVDVTDPGTDPAAVNQYALSAWCANCHDKTGTIPVMSAAAGALSAKPAVEAAAGTGTAAADGTGTADGTAAPTSTETTFSVTVKPNVSAATKSSGSGITGSPASELLVTTSSNSAYHETQTEHTMATMQVSGMSVGVPQCYTCHRGGLSQKGAGDTLSTEQINQLASLGYTLPTDNSCAICHYGTADFATDSRMLDGSSDWPHSSAGDVSLLGNWTVDFSNLSNLQTPPGTSQDKTLIEDNVQTDFCGRCHPGYPPTGGLLPPMNTASPAKAMLGASAPTTLTFYYSLHTLTHSYPTNSSGAWKTSGTIGTLKGTYSPGYTKP